MDKFSVNTSKKPSLLPVAVRFARVNSKKPRKRVRIRNG